MDSAVPVTVFFGNPIGFESQLNQENGNRKNVRTDQPEVMLGFRQLKRVEQFKTDQGWRNVRSRQRRCEGRDCEKRKAKGGILKKLQRCLRQKMKRWT
jgi:hypothetical protein